MHLYGLIIGISIAIGIDYFHHHNTTVPKYLETKFLFFGILSALIGARLYHVLDYWSYYSSHLLEIPQTWHGGLAIYGALIAAILYLLIFSFINHISTLSLLDTITPIIPLCQSIGRFGNFVNQEIPTWWLESLLNFFLFLIIHRFPKKPTATYLIGYGLIRFILEFLRSDTWTISQIKIAQIISIFFILLGIFLFRPLFKSKKM